MVSNVHVFVNLSTTHSGQYELGPLLYSSYMYAEVNVHVLLMSAVVTKYTMHTIE